MNEPNLLYLHICEDVRQEEGGKVSLMGLYGSSIFVPQLPYLFPKLCFYSRFDGIKETHFFNFKIISPSGQETKVIENSPCHPEEFQNQGLFNVVATPFELAEVGEYTTTITIVDSNGDGVEGRLFDDEQLYKKTYNYSQKFSVLDITDFKNES